VSSVAGIVMDADFSLRNKNPVAPPSPENRPGSPQSMRHPTRMAKSPKSLEAPRKSWLAKLGIGARAWKRDNLPARDEVTVADSMLYGAGMTTVASLLTSGARGARTRQDIYDKWSRMESDPIVSAGVKLLVTAALGGHETTGDIVYIDKTPEADQDAKLGSLVDELRGDLIDELNRVAYPLAYMGAVFGDAYARLYADSRGLRDIYIDELVRPPLVQPFERGSRTLGYAVYTGESNFQRLDSLQMARLKMPRSQWIPQHGVVEKSLRLHLQADDVDQLPLMPAMVGGSLIYPAEDAYDNLTASLLGLVGQRWLDSIDEQMLTVNLTDMSKDHQAKFLESITAMLKRSKSLAEEAVKGGRPILERIRHIVPVFGEKQLTTVQPANGGQPGRSNSHYHRGCDAARAPALGRDRRRPIDDRLRGSDVRRAGRGRILPHQRASGRIGARDSHRPGAHAQSDHRCPHPAPLRDCVSGAVAPVEDQFLRLDFSVGVRAAKDPAGRDDSRHDAGADNPRTERSRRAAQGR
jgi:hypothetical protein